MTVNACCMGCHVLLISINQYDFPYPVFPLGLAQVEAALRSAHHETRLVDWNLEQPSIEELVRDFPPDLVGISLRNIDDALIQRKQTFFNELTDLCHRFRSVSPAPIVLGGSGFSIFPAPLLARSGADYGVQGEGERPLLQLIDHLQAGTDPTAIPGLVYRRDQHVVINPRTDPMPAATINIPDADDRLAAFYLQRSSMLNVQTQRGCALRCCYCTYPLLEGRSYRRRPAEAVADELEQAHRRGARYVFLVDSVFNTSPDHVAGICEAILHRQLSLKWCCFLRPQHLTRDLMDLMARAGLTHIEFGSDSFCDSVLHEYGKHLTFDDILHSSELARRANIDYAHFLICGGPGETRETLQTSFLNSHWLPAATIMARVGMRVYPGTPLHTRLLQERGADAVPDLLQPFYYVTPNLTEPEVFGMLHDATGDLPNWIFTDPPPTYFKMAERLRARGVIGPLWSYFAMMQRLGGLVPAQPVPADR
jgi:radical SAM superfamily enzyme YgiQ (UPF0313 family)